MSDLDQGIETYDMMLRWSKGESLVDLGKECDPPISDAVLRLRMRKLDCIDYDKAKDEAAKARVSMSHAENKYIVSKNKQRMTKLLDDEETEISVGDHCKIEKTFGDRVALVDGEATERQEQVGKVTQIILFKDLTSDDTE